MLCACSSSPEVRQMSGTTWGTTYHITYSSPDNLSTQVLEQMHRIDSTLSMFNPDSEVSRINVSTEPTRVSKSFLDVFEVSCRANRLSSGAFDPTVAPLVDLWGFGRNDRLKASPDSAEIASSLERVGINRCSVSSDSVLTKAHPLTEFDFSAVAKGYGVDCIAQVFTRARVHNYMVEVGGEIALSGKNPRGDLWRIQIDAPITSDTLAHQRLTVLALTDCCIATSGNYRRFRTTPEGTFGHTISPSTGTPVSSSTLSATVIAPSCAMADALATACMAMPHDKAIAMIDSLPGTSAMLVIASPDSQAGPFRLIASKSWPENDR